MNPLTVRQLPLVGLTCTALMAAGPSWANEPQRPMGPRAFGRLDLAGAIAALPKTSKQPFVDAPLLDNGETGIRVFRVYRKVPRHSHAFSSTYLVIHSGRGRFRLKGATTFEAGAGDMVFWERGVDHEVIEILEEPLVFIAIDAPTRRDGDVQKPGGS